LGQIQNTEASGSYDTMRLIIEIFTDNTDAWHFLIKLVEEECYNFILDFSVILKIL